jgi:hypothetical protein
LLLLSKAHPKVKALVRHAKALGHIHYPVTALGHLLDCLSFEFRWVSDSLHD